MIADLGALVMVETPSEDLTRLRVGVELLAQLIRQRTGAIPTVLDDGPYPHLLLRAARPGGILLLGHLDTVWPAGTTSRWPFSVDGEVATGPGVFDMKAGLVQALYALAAPTGIPDDISLLVTTDEETGSASGRALVEDQARRARAVLVLEPSAAGALKTARKGVSMYRLHVAGRAAHAGLNPERGINAMVELAEQVRRVVRFADPAEGTTVTPTLASAGTTSNTVPAAADLALDVRAFSLVELERVDRALQKLEPALEGASLRLTGGINRPPLESAVSARLARLAERCAGELGLPAPGRATVGGASDGNFTGALGVPTLDGLGAVGDHAHAEGEYILVGAMAERAALLHALIQTTPREEPV